MANPYDEAEFEKEDHLCEICGKQLTYEEWECGNDMCDECMIFVMAVVEETLND